MTMFNGYIMTNWSGASSRVYRTSSIFVVSLIDGKEEVKDFSTRARAHDYITCIMDKASKNKKRLLLCFDFAFGYPAKAYDELGCKNWEKLWELINTEIDDSDSNKNNRFDVANKLNLLFAGEGPFWGKPANYTQYKNILTNRPKRFAKGSNDPLQFRTIETHIPNAKSVWQLAYNGCVGSKTLMGIPALQKLKEHKEIDCVIWPFENIDDTDKHVIAEIYPAIWDEKKSQMTIEERLCRTLKIISCLDKNGTLKNLLQAPHRHPCKNDIIKKEGWILGVDKNGNPAQCP